MKPETKYLSLLALLYFIVSLFGILHHELWLDESHHWLLSRDSATFGELIKNTRYEGHPILWNVLLFGITRFTLNPFWMQLLHISISTTVVIIFLRKAPFSLVFKSLFIFGYFMIFEYNLISRNYILGVLFLFLACSVFQERKSKFILLSVFLALAANTHAMFSVIAFALFLTLLLENFLEKRMFARQYVLGYFVFLIGLLLFVIQVIPPGDTKFFNHANEMAFGEKFIKGFMSLFKGTATIPDFSSIHFWNSNMLVNFSKPASAVMGLLAYLVPLVLYKKRKTLFFVYTALLGTQIFFFATQLGATRYDGMTYIIIIIGLWIEYYFSPDKYKIRNFLVATKFRFLKRPIVYSLLLVQFFSGVTAYTMDYKYQFTTAKEAVVLLKQINPGNSTILCVFCEGTVLSPYLEKKLYFLCESDLGSYCDWQSACPRDISTDDVIGMVSDYMKTHASAVFVTGQSYSGLASYQWKKINNTFKIRLVKKTGQSIVRNNTFQIYQIVRLPVTNYAE